MRLPSQDFALRGGAVVGSGARRPSGLSDALRLRLAGWLQQRRERRTREMRLQSIEGLDRYILRDIGLDEELQAIALARRDSQYARGARSAAAGSAADRFGF